MASIDNASTGQRIALTKDPHRTFRLYSARDFAQLPEIDWKIDRVLPSGSLAALYGPSGIGKSFLAIDLIAASTVGADWFGFSTKPGPAVYVALEGQAGIRMRVKAWEVHNGHPFPDRVEFQFDALDLGSMADAYALAYAIDQSYGASLIVIDTLNRASPGFDENSSIDMGRVIQGASALQAFTGATVILVHHPGKDATRGLRGHSSLFAAMDTVIEVGEDGANLRWRVVKSKDGERGISGTFQLSPVRLGANARGSDLTSCVVVPLDDQSAAPFQSKQPRGTNQQAVLEAATEIFVAQRLEIGLIPIDEPAQFTDGLAYADLIERTKDALESVDASHRKSRSEEAVKALVRMGLLDRIDNLIRLPQSRS